MGEYPHAAWAGLSPNRDERTGDIRWFVIHHYAGTQDPESARARFMGANDRSVSPNFQVNADGSVFEIVPPRHWRAWTGGAVDQYAVTCETQNTSGDPDWGISDESHEAIAQLVAWAHGEFGIPLDRDHVFGDREVTEKTGIDTRSTACPGPSMRLDWIVDRARQIVSGDTAAATPVPEEDDTMKLKYWGGHALLIGLETVYHVTNDRWLAYLEDHYGPGSKLDNEALTLELCVNAIPWDAVDACLRGAAMGNDGRHWSRLQAEGVAIRGKLDRGVKTLADVVKTAETITPIGS